MSGWLIVLIVWTVLVTLIVLFMRAATRNNREDDQ